MLSGFDNTLKNLLVRRIPLDPDEVEVSFECPKREWAAKVLKPTVNLYLHDMRENVELRKTSWSTERGLNGGLSGHRRPPVYIDLSYTVTTWARNVADEHQLLWRVMTALMREPEIGEDVLQGALKAAGPPVKTLTAQADGILRNPGDFWGALDNDLKPVITYTATLAADLDVVREAPLVLTSIINIGDTGNGRRQRALIEVGGTVRQKPAKKGAAREPIAAAVLTFPQLGLAAQSDREGRYRVGSMPEGTHRVQIVNGSAVAERELQVPAPSYDVEV